MNKKNRLEKIIGGGTLIGVLINLIVLTYVDQKSCISPPCDPYIFYLIGSIFIGVLIRTITLKNDKE